MATGYWNIVANALVGATAVSNNNGDASDSGWLNLGKYMSLSLQIEGLEGGGQLTITGFNGSPNGPFPPLTELGSPIITPNTPAGIISANEAFFVGGSYTYVRLRKTTAGGGPTPTNANFSSQQPK